MLRLYRSGAYLYFAGAAVCLLLTAIFTRMPLIGVVFAIGTLYLIISGFSALKSDPYDLNELREIEEREEVLRYLDEEEEDEWE
ncbi:MAG: hypothetical protein AB1725_04575 [Armatimonadota bacterium]